MEVVLPGIPPDKEVDAEEGGRVDGGLSSLPLSSIIGSLPGI